MALFSKKESVPAQAGGEAKARGKASARGYGIAEAMLLMRTLPVDQNVELVVRVIRSTLESMDVQLPDIIDDAVAKEKTLESRMETLNGEIAEFSKQIDMRRQEIGRIEGELTETTTVKERLLLAQKLAGQPTARPPAPAGKAAPGTPPAPPPIMGKMSGKGAAELREAR